MARLPVLSGRKIIAALGKVGYSVGRRRGSHMRALCPGRNPVTVPDYRTVDRALWKKILRDAELTGEEFLRLLKG